MNTKEYVITIYDQFKDYAEKHSLREMAENLRCKPWDIIRLSDTMLIIEQTIEGVEYRVRIAKAGDIINVQVSTWKF